MRRSSWSLFLLLSLSLLADPGTLAGQERPEEVIAVLDGEPILRRDVEPGVGFHLYRLKAEIYSLTKREAEEIAEQRLLAREAARRGVGVAELLEAEIDAKVAEPQTAEIEAYLAEHPQGGGDAATRKSRARSFLHQRALAQRRLDFFAALRAAADYRLVLEPPERPRSRVDVEGHPSRGSPDAAVTIVQFSHYGAALAAQSDRYVRQAMAEFPGRIRWVQRHFLNRIDEAALEAARIAAFAHEKGRFWEFHDALTAHGGALAAGDIEQAARRAGLDLEEFREAEKSDRYLSRVKADLDAGRRLGLTSAPVMFVNGFYFSVTFPYDQLRQIIARELASPAGG